MYDLSRRDLVLGTLAAGFAVAALPISAETITTDARGLTAGDVKIPVPDGTMSAYRAMPEKRGPHPVVLVVQEVFGVHGHIRDVCRRLAKLGYLAIAPDLYERQGDPMKAANMQEILPIVSKVPDAQVLADLDAAVLWAAASSAGDTKRLGITGFCWGGRITWIYAAHNPDLKAGVAWYGRLTSAATELQPNVPVELASKLHAPVLGLYGGEDKGIPLADVEKMRAALAKSDSGSEIVVFPTAQHGFFADYRPSYDEASAKAAWARMHEWFRKHGVA